MVIRSEERALLGRKGLYCSVYQSTANPFDYHFDYCVCIFGKKDSDWELWKKTNSLLTKLTTKLEASNDQGTS